MIIAYFAVLVFIVCILYQIMKGIIAMFKKLFKKESKKEDIDFDKLNWNIFLENEAKFQHQKHQVKRASLDDKMTLGYILGNILDVEKKDISKMCVVFRDNSQDITTNVMESIDDIWNYDMFSTVIEPNDEGGWKFQQGQNTVLIIGYMPSQSVLDKPHERLFFCHDNSIIIFLRGLIADGSAWYMRASIMIPNFNTQDDDLKTQFSKNAPLTTSFILAFDGESPEEKKKKFEKVRLSLEEKVRKNEGLDEDEKILLKGITSLKTVGRDLGDGQFFLSQKRYTDALYPFLEIYDSLGKEFYKLDKDGRDIFFEACYRIGFCFNELRKYDKAFFYLDIARMSNKPSYKIEYINSLVNSGDMRALSYVGSEIDEIREKKEELSEEEFFYYRFLYRRLAYLYIEYKMFDEAKNLLEQMKENELDRDFAIGELEYLEKIKGETK